MVPFLFSAKGVQSMNQNTKPTERKGAEATSLPDSVKIFSQIVFQPLGSR